MYLPEVFLLTASVCCPLIPRMSRVVYHTWPVDDCRTKRSWPPKLDPCDPGNKHKAFKFTTKRIASGCYCITIYLSSWSQLSSASPHVRESGFRNLGNVCLWDPESWALESGIQHKESGMPLKTAIRNPGSTGKEYGIQYLESVIHGVESKIIPLHGVADNTGMALLHVQSSLDMIYPGVAASKRQIDNSF